MNDESKDIRWKQRLANYTKALSRLKKFIEKGELNELEELGIIHAFEFTHELVWNVMKDYLTHQGIQDIIGSRDAVRQSFSSGLIVDGEGWMEMIKSRNASSHTYDEAIAKEIRIQVVNRYFPLFVTFEERMLSLI